MLLTDEIGNDKFRYGRYMLHVDMSFDNILLFHQMLDDDSLNDTEKVVIGLEMLLYDYDKVAGLSYEKQFDIFKYIMKDYLGVDLDPDEQSTETEGEPQQKEYDFNIDADRIYASFLMDYNMDLFEQQGKLHWDKFIALFSGLSEKTPFMQVVNIRTMEVPKANKHNTKKRQRIQKLKRRYALEQKKNDMNSALDQAADFLKGR